MITTEAEYKDRLVHITAEISPEAILGENVQVGPMAHVGEGCVVGEGTHIHRNALVSAHVLVGENCRIGNNSSLYFRTILEDNVFIGPNVVFTNDHLPRVHDMRDRSRDEMNWQAGVIRVREGASIGAGSVILPNVIIGKYAMVGAGSVVTTDVPDYALVFGNPARFRNYVCACGAKIERDSTPGEFCKSCSRRDIMQ